MARIHKDKSMINLGCFDTAGDAYATRMAKEIEMFGKFRRSN